jgi:hypothetical protein
MEACRGQELADHLVGLEEERRGNGAAEGLGGLEVDDQLERRGLLHRQVGGQGSFIGGSTIGRSVTPNLSATRVHRCSPIAGAF